MGKCLKPGGKKWERRFWQGGIWEKKNYYVITRDEIQGMGGENIRKKIQTSQMASKNDSRYRILSESDNSEVYETR